MAYMIRYGGTRHVIQKPGRGRLLLFTGLFFVIFLLGVQLLWDDGAASLRQLLFPFHEHTKTAADAMVHSIQEGTSVAEAVTAFCQEIIDHAAIP